MRLLGKYRVIAKLGQGGMAEVFLAIASGPAGFNKLVVIKQLAEDLAEDPDFVAMFLDEARLAARLNHPNVVQTHAVSTEDGRYFIAMEYIPGPSLHHVLLRLGREGGLPVAMTVRVLIDMLAGLDYAHELTDFDGRLLGVIHRDVSPQNVLISTTGQVKLVDFGVAKVLSAPTQTRAGVIKGKPAYMAPEQERGEHVDRRADLYSVGVMLWEGLTGRRAFKERGAHTIRLRDLPRPRAVSPTVPERLDAICARALAVKPSERHPSAAALRADLEDALATLGERPDLRDLGRTVTRIFAEEQAQIRALLEAATADQRLALHAGDLSLGEDPKSLPSLHAPLSERSTELGEAPPPRSAASPPGLAVGPAGPAGPANVASDLPAPSSAAPPHPTSRWRDVALPIAAAALTALIGAGLGWRVMSGERAPAGSGVSQAALSAAPPATPASVPARKDACPVGMVMVPGGTFVMGSDDPSFKLWSPAHKVSVDTFCIDANEVTAAQYRTCADAGACERPPAKPEYPRPAGMSAAEHEKGRAAQAELCTFDKPGREDHPINCVSWYLADTYCKSAHKRLPTEAEWEFVARGSGEHRYPWGDEASDGAHMNACGLECNAWETAHGLKLSARMYDADDGFPGTAPVGSFPKGRTALGVSDLIGNVWEWTGDWFEVYHDEEQLNPKGASAGTKKAIRGGGFNGGVRLWLTPAFRYHQLASASAAAIGFRCAARL